MRDHRSRAKSNLPHMLRCALEKSNAYPMSCVCFFPQVQQLLEGLPSLHTLSIMYSGAEDDTPTTPQVALQVAMHQLQLPQQQQQALQAQQQGQLQQQLLLPQQHQQQEVQDGQEEQQEAQQGEAQPQQQQQQHGQGQEGVLQPQQQEQQQSHWQQGDFEPQQEQQQGQGDFQPQQQGQQQGEGQEGEPAQGELPLVVQQLQQEQQLEEAVAVQQDQALQQQQQLQEQGEQQQLQDQIPLQQQQLHLQLQQILQHNQQLAVQLQQQLQQVQQANEQLAVQLQQQIQQMHQQLHHIARPPPSSFHMSSVWAMSWLDQRYREAREEELPGVAVLHPQHGILTRNAALKSFLESTTWHRWAGERGPRFLGGVAMARCGDLAIWDGRCLREDAASIVCAVGRQMQLKGGLDMR